MTSRKQPVCLSIAGLDPSGGAGILADIKTFSAFGCFGAAAVTSLTFQNTTGVFGATHVSAEDLRSQIEPIFDDYEVAAVKTGMLPTRAVIEVVAHIIKDREPSIFVVDPVVVSTSGFDLIDDEALSALCESLFPLATLVTPNLPEAARITGIRIDDEDSAAAAVHEMGEMGARSILLKGGHTMTTGSGAPPLASDTLYHDGTFRYFSEEFIHTTSTHGTGCTLASAIAAGMALGNDVPSAVAVAKAFVTEAIRTAPGLGRGHGPVNHLARLKPIKPPK